MKPRPVTITILSLAMACACWLGLAYLVLYLPPDTFGRVLFLCLLFLAAGFSGSPLLLAIHLRVTPNRQDISQVAVWREAGLVGLFCSLCAWLRFIRVLTWANALLLIAVLALTEMLLLARRGE